MARAPSPTTLHLIVTPSPHHQPRMRVCSGAGSGAVATAGRPCTRRRAPLRRGGAPRPLITTTPPRAQWCDVCGARPPPSIAALVLYLNAGVQTHGPTRRLPTPSLPPSSNSFVSPLHCPAAFRDFLLCFYPRTPARRCFLGERTRLLALQTRRRAYAFLPVRRGRAAAAAGAPARRNRAPPGRAAPSKPPYCMMPRNVVAGARARARGSPLRVARAPLPFIPGGTPSPLSLARHPRFFHHPPMPPPNLFPLPANPPLYPHLLNRTVVIHQ